MAMKEKGCTIVMKQGSNPVKLSFSGKHANIDEIAGVLEATGAYGHFGHNLRFDDNTVVAPEGSSGIKMVPQRLICERDGGAPVFISGIFPQEKKDILPITTKLKALSIGGMAVEGVTRRLQNEEL